MISGESLHHSLSAQRDYVQCQLIRITRNMLDMELRLNLLRLDEVVAWRAYSNLNHTEQLSIQNIRTLITKHYDKAHRALDTAESYDKEIVVLRNHKANLSIQAANAKSVFEIKDREVREELEQSGVLHAYRTACKKIEEHIFQIQNWVRDSKSQRAEILSSLNSSRIFIYLLNKQEVSDKRISYLDRVLMRLIGYEAKKQEYDNAYEYPLSAKQWQLDLEDRISDINKESASIEHAALSSLNQYRKALIETKNELNHLDIQLHHKETEVRDAMRIVVAMVLGKDKEYAHIIETFVNVLAQERASAVIEFARNPSRQSNSHASQIDLIVGKRHSLSVESDGQRRQATIALARLKLLENILEKMELRQWSSSDTRFDIETNDSIFADIVDGNISFDDAWTHISSKVTQETKKPKTEADLDFDLSVKL